jgi:hypothetical protein
MHAARSLIPLALLAVPLVITTTIIALRARPAKREHAGLSALLLVIGFLGLAAALPLFRFLAPVPALISLLLGCFAFHGAVYLSRRPQPVSESRSVSRLAP